MCHGIMEYFQVCCECCVRLFFAVGKLLTVLLVLIAVVIFAVGCEKSETAKNDKSADTQKGGKQMEITSSAFDDGHKIPVKFTGEGINVSPPLNWSNVPEETKSIAIIADDPDAPMGTWVHWVIYNIPAEMDGLDEGVKNYLELDDGILQGRNDFGQTGYGGPMPPRGAKHRYFFKMYALDEMLGISSGVSKQGLVDAMQGHILAEAKLMGTYQR